MIGKGKSSDVWTLFTQAYIVHSPNISKNPDLWSCVGTVTVSQGGKGTTAVGQTSLYHEHLSPPEQIVSRGLP